MSEANEGLFLLNHPQTRITEGNPAALSRFCFLSVESLLSKAKEKQKPANERSE